MCVCTGMIRADAELLEAVHVLLPESGYVLCPGIPVDLYRYCWQVVRFHSKEVRWAAFWVLRVNKFFFFVVQATIAALSPYAQFMHLL